MTKENTRRRVAIITGGGSGIGRAIVEEFARNGVDSVIAGRRADALEETRRRLVDAPGEVVTVVADITDPEDRERLVTTCVERFGTQSTCSSTTREQRLPQHCSTMAWMIGEECSRPTWRRVSF